MGGVPFLVTVGFNKNIPIFVEEDELTIIIHCYWEWDIMRRWLGWDWRVGLTIF